MKFQVTFKTPDVLDPVLEGHMDTHCDEHEEHDPDCDACAELEERGCMDMAIIKSCANKFIQYGEYVTIEFDTDSGTATVQKV